MIDIDYKDSVVYQYGKHDGLLEGKIEAAKAEDDPYDRIARMTRLSIEDIKRL